MPVGQAYAAAHPAQGARCRQRARQAGKASPNHSLACLPPNVSPGAGHGPRQQGSCPLLARRCRRALHNSPSQPHPQAVHHSQRAWPGGPLRFRLSGLRLQFCHNLGGTCCIKPSHPQLMRNGMRTLLSVSQSRRSRRSPGMLRVGGSADAGCKLPGPPASLCAFAPQAMPYAGRPCPVPDALHG